MRGKFLKGIGIVVLSVGLILSQAVVSFADTKGKMDPDDYLFLTVFRACGVSPGVDVGRWVGLYKGYLKLIGNQALLSQVEGYASLNWGDTAQGIDTIFKSVKEWLSLSGSYGTESTGYSLPSSPSPQVQGLQVSPYISISSQPFPESSCSKPGYHYVFSQSFKDRISSIGFRENYYFPDGVEIIALADKDYRTSDKYFNGIGVTFYMVDRSSDSGYSLAPGCFAYTAYEADGSALSGTYEYERSSVSVNPDICSLMNFPVYVFGSVEDMETYCKTGVVNNTFNNNSGFVFSLDKSGGLDSELQKKGIASLGSSMVLPGSLEEASASVETFQKPLSRDELMAVLNRNGMSAVYNAEYKVEHLRESMTSGSDGVPEWEKYSEEVFYGASGSSAAFTPLDLEGYAYVPELTEPEKREILADESLVIRLYYTLKRAPYVVEHYTQRMIPGEEGEKWELADTETLQGIPGMKAEYSAKDYSGYAFKGSLTEPSDCQVLSDGSLVVRLYYVQAPFSVLAEPINKTVGSFLPVAAVIGSIFSGGVFLLKLYKRISARA